MRVLLVSQYYPPEIGATQNRMQSFASALAMAGADVDVLTEMPNHPTGVIAPEFDGRWFDTTTMHGCRVVRVRVATWPHKTFWTRLAFYFSFVAMALAARSRLANRYDVVLATSPPLPAAGAGLLLARWTRARFVLDVRDLWPKAAAALGELNNQYAYRAAAWLESTLYRHARRVLVTTRAFADDLAARGVPAARIVHVPNGAQLDIFGPRPSATLRAELGLTDSLVVIYAGLHGIAQGLEAVLAAAERLGGTSVRFLLVGDGPRKTALMADARARGLQSVTFLPAVPVARCAEYLAAADLILVPLSANPLFTMFVPSKLFDGMATGKPVILMVDGEARQILEQAGAGVFVAPGDADALAAAIRALGDDGTRRASMGRAGRAFVERHYSRAVQGARVAAIVSTVATEDDRGTA